MPVVANENHRGDADEDGCVARSAAIGPSNQSA
jgi:hypothetical protein